MTTLHLLSLRKVPIFQQLQIEEELLRTDRRNFCLLNIGSPRAIVLGISGSPEQCIDRAMVQREQIPLIRRFSGGGTVIVDEETLFVTFLFEKGALPIPPLPESIHRWMVDLYLEAWGIPEFALRENDYVIGERKCGGNAQYFQKERWLHHTSFLWNYRPENMAALPLPSRRPVYRNDRTHTDFLCPLSSVLQGNPEQLLEQLLATLVKRFYIQPFPFTSCGTREHRKTTQRIVI